MKWKSKGISLIAVCLTLIACQGYSGDPAGQALLPDIPDSWSAEKVDPSPLPSEAGPTIEFDKRVLALILESIEHNRDLRSAQASLELAIAGRNTDRADLFQTSLLDYLVVKLKRLSVMAAASLTPPTVLNFPAVGSWIFGGG